MNIIIGPLLQDLSKFERNTAFEWLNQNGFVNQKLCYFQIWKILEYTTKKILKNGW